MRRLLYRELPFVVLCLAGGFAAASEASDLAAKVVAESRKLAPVDVQTLNQARAWLEFTTSELQKLTRAWANRDEFRELAGTFDPAKLLREVRSAEPDPERLGRLRDDVHRAREQLVKHKTLMHALQTVATLLGQYVELTDTAVQPGAERQDLTDKLDWLNKRLLAQAKEPSAEKLEPIYTMIAAVNAMELAGQLQADPASAKSRQLAGDLSRSLEAAGAHAGLVRGLRAVDAALSSYAALLETVTRRDAVEQELTAHLQLLGSQLGQYERAPTAQNVRTLHTTITWLRQHRQALSLTAEIRDLYLRPKMQVYASKDLLNEIARLLIPESIRINESEGGFQITGRATTPGSLRVETIDNPDCGVLGLRFCSPVWFSGTVRRGRFHLGVSSGLSLNIRKDCYILQDNTDSLPTDSRSALLRTETDCGCLIDRAVDGIARRKFDGRRVNEAITGHVNHGTEVLANFVSMQAKLVVNPNPMRMGLVRCYSTSERGVELVVRTSDDPRGKHDPLPEPNPDADFSITIHTSLLNSLTMGEVLGKDRQHTLHSLRDLAYRAFELKGRVFDGPEFGRVTIAPPPEQFVFYEKETGKLNITFLARRRPHRPATRSCASCTWNRDLTTPEEPLHQRPGRRFCWTIWR